MHKDHKRNLADWRCKHCDARIAFGSKRCSECGSRQGYSVLNEKVVVAIAGLGGIFFLMGLFGLIALPYAIWSGEYDLDTAIWSTAFFVLVVLIPGVAYVVIWQRRN